MTKRAFALRKDDQIAQLRARAHRLERLCAELATEASDLTELASALTTPPLAEPPALLSVEQCAQTLGLSRTSTFSLVRGGQLRSLKVGSRRLITRASLDEFIVAATEGISAVASGAEAV